MRLGASINAEDLVVAGSDKLHKRVMVEIRIGDRVLRMIGEGEDEAQAFTNGALRFEWSVA